ncbi:MAG: hypothetical protein JWR36_1759 [Glaciihabitans sp.]|nr:hypothetical protein [Glaciihabitans sp.]
MRELGRLRWLLILVPFVEVSHGARANTVGLALLGGSSSAAYTLDALAAAALVATGLALVPRHRLRSTGWLLSATGICLPLAIVPGNLSGSSIVFTATLVLPSVGSAGIAAALACWPSGAVSRVLVSSTCAILGVGAIVRGLASASVYDPRDAGCNSCAADLVGIASNTDLSYELARWGEVTVAVGSAAALAISLRVMVRMSHAARRLNGPLLFGLAVAVAASGVRAGYVGSQRLAVAGSTENFLWRSECLALLSLGVAAAWRLRTIRKMTLRFAGEVVGTAGEPDRVLAMLREAADNMSVVVAAVRADGSAVDADGRAVRTDSDSIVITRQQDVVAEIRFTDQEDALLDRLHAVVPSLGLGIERLAARARLRAELADLTDSRVRLVGEMDLERRKLERDLHDGAQQRLLALLVAVQRGARRGSSEDRGQFALAAEELSAMLAETRAIARGIHQVVLTDAGLVQGLRALAEQSPVELAVQADHVGPSSGLADAAVYRLVADLLAACEEDGVPALSVQLSHAGTSLRVRARASLVDVDLQHARDRIESLGGHLEVVRAEDLLVEALVPLAFEVARDQSRTT